MLEVIYKPYANWYPMTQVTSIKKPLCELSIIGINCHPLIASFALQLKTPAKK